MVPGDMGDKVTGRSERGLPVAAAADTLRQVAAQIGINATNHAPRSTLEAKVLSVLYLAEGPTQWNMPASLRALGRSSANLRRTLQSLEGDQRSLSTAMRETAERLGFSTDVRLSITKAIASGEHVRRRVVRTTTADGRVTESVSEQTPSASESLAAVRHVDGMVERESAGAESAAGKRAFEQLLRRIRQ
jgi:hypothetical protein